MESKVIFALLGVIINLLTVSCKLNSPCKGIDDTTCINIQDDLAYSYLHPRCFKFSNRVSTQMETFYAGDLIRRAETNPNGACVYFNKMHINGQQEPRIACMELNQAEEFCPNLAANETIEHFKLQACVMCGSKYFIINSGVTIVPQNLILIGLYFLFMI
ncbi:uncharacterized protein [Onthophagus taurus]|uniref:uncharacterized protein n=1 Tax=Onthophagus taurus TaxID=166361 RepID=UPI000C205D37|nr:uncharacterized protein LOC111426742 [Onthophagus taurus]